MLFMEEPRPPTWTSSAMASILRRAFKKKRAPAGRARYDLATGVLRRLQSDECGGSWSSVPGEAERVKGFVRWCREVGIELNPNVSQLPCSMLPLLGGRCGGTGRVKGFVRQVGIELRAAPQCEPAPVGGSMFVRWCREVGELHPNVSQHLCSMLSPTYPSWR